MSIIGESLGKVFSVTRGSATGKSNRIGDFTTLDEAQSAMMDHYKNNAKRGKFFYTINQEEISVLDGVQYRSSCFGLGGKGWYYKRYDANELKEMAT